MQDVAGAGAVPTCFEGICLGFLSRGCSTVQGFYLPFSLDTLYCFIAFLLSVPFSVFLLFLLPACFCFLACLLFCCFLLLIFCFSAPFFTLAFLFVFVHVCPFCPSASALAFLLFCLALVFLLLFLSFSLLLFLLFYHS